MIDIVAEKARYEELINLEALDRRLQEDIRRFADDQFVVDCLIESRRAVQNRMLYLTLRG